MKDVEGKRKVGYETREFKSKGPYMFFRIVCALRSRAAWVSSTADYCSINRRNYVQTIRKYERITSRQESSCRQRPYH